jgi:hypothetical protein
MERGGPLPQLEPREFVLYYAALIVLALIVFVRRRPRKGMRLRLRGGGGGSAAREEKLTGAEPPAMPGYSHIQPSGERPLNVVFNYNGHSWDAYEVLGLEAGSSLEKVEVAFREAAIKVEAGSRPFLEAAYQAILAEWKVYRGA